MRHDYTVRRHDYNDKRNDYNVMRHEYNVKCQVKFFHAIADFKQFVFANIYKEQFFICKSCQDDHNIVIMPHNVIII